ncbi:hypothetical protein SAMN02745218_01204 [Desulfofundulus australicus DSM 11792]|uniref:Uncharacterized protein n=2 Tax=Desulfofundulus TaxID=2282741 RepID=A0A1M4XXV5_9FIRM|nr:MULTISPECIES: hypothetical protein [Desulfofundulus]MDQ0287739.1 hypothetical protein [Desulfofundulus luciae]SHE98072.1 hypothetical protein SAMN02745218_01204 [Desulfofundulus australicus DSM 11792]
MDITWEKIVALLTRIKDGSVILGILYFISFLLVLPFWLSEAPSEIDIRAVLLLATVSAIFLTHMFLNWAYYALIVVPAIAASCLFTLGAFIWVTTPLIVAPIQAIFGMFGSGFGADMGNMIAGRFMGAFGSMFTGLGESISRTGQLLMIISGWFWWLNDRLRNIDYKALGFYLLCLAVLGFATGIPSMEGIIVFLYVWLWFTYKIQNKEGLPNLTLVFKIVASLAVLLKFPYYFSMASSNPGLGFYGVSVSSGLLVLIWKFEWLLSKSPEGIRRFFGFLTERYDRTFFTPS